MEQDHRLLLLLQLMSILVQIQIVKELSFPLQLQLLYITPRLRQLECQGQVLSEFTLDCGFEVRYVLCMLVQQEMYFTACRLYNQFVT
jgi:hypothetical protein